MSYGLKPTIRERVLHTHWKACVEAIRDRFPALSPRLAAIVLGYAVDGRLPPAWDTEEIARKIGIPPGNFSELMPEIHRIVEKAAEKPPVNLPSTKAGSSGHRRWALALALVTLSLTGVVLADQNGAFQDGKSLGSSVNQSAFSGINSGAASDKIPGYGTNPSETQFFQGGQGQLSGPGVAKMQNCATATPDSDPIKRQECEAVNFLARNPNTRPQFDLSNNPMFARAKNIRNNAENIFASLGMGGTGSTTQCVPRTITTPAQYSTDTCSSIREVGEQQCTMGRVINIDADANFQCEQTVNAYETLKCRRGFSPDFGVQNSTNTYTPSFGNEVPPWTAKTFNINIDIDPQASSITATLREYRVDNYGQLWINGTLVYQNVLPGYGDMRNGYIKYECTSDGYEGYWCGYVFKSASGSSNDFYDDSCNWGCRGVSPNIDISAPFRKGSNTITLVCANARSIGPCYASIAVTTQRVTVTGSTVVNGCAALEARAR